MARNYDALTRKLRRWLGTSKQVDRTVRNTPSAKPAARRLAVEPLEDRVVPAVDYAAMATEFTSRLETVSGIVKSAADQSTAVLPILGESISRQATDVQSAVRQLKTKLATALQGLNGNAGQQAIRTALLNAGIVRDLGNNGVDGNDILIPDAEFRPNSGSITITMRLGTKLTIADKTYNFDLGLPGVPLGITGNSTLNVGVDVDYDRLTFGMVNGSFFVRSPAGRSNTLTVSVVATAQNSNLDGTIGFFQVTGSEMKLPNGKSSGLPTAELRAGLAFNADGLTITSPRLTGSAAVNMNLDAAIRSVSTNVTFPHMTTDFQMRWNLGGAHDVSSRTSLGSAPTVEFNNIQFGLGSFLGSMMMPVAEIVRELTNPLAPVYELMKTRLPGLSELSEAIGGKAVTIDSLAGAVVGSGALPPDYQLLADLGVKLHTLISLIRDAEFTENDFLIPVGSFNLSGNGDLRGSTLTNGFTTLKQWAQNGINNLSLKSLTNLVPVATAGLESIQQKINLGKLPGPVRDAVQNTFRYINDRLRTLENGIGLTFPLLDDPVSIYKLLLGQDVDFARFDAKFFGTATETKTFPVWGPITAKFDGSITAQAEFHAGVDTYGLRTFFMDIAAGRQADPAKLADGLWIDSSKELARVKGSIEAKGGLDQAFGAGVQLFAFAGISGRVWTPDDIVVTFVDLDRNNRAPDDNRLRPTKPGAVGNALFQVQGSLVAEFSFVVHAGVRVNLAVTTVERKVEVYRKELLRETLFDTSAKIDTRNTIPSRPPVPSKIDVVYDVNSLNGANDGQSDTIRARFTANKLYLYFNDVRTESYDLKEVNSLKIIGSDDSERITIEGLSRPVRVDGGRGRDDFEFDDSTSAGPSPIYVLSDGRIARFRSGVNFLTYDNVESLFVQGANVSSTYYINPLSELYAVISGGEGNDKFYFGSNGATLQNAFNYINIVDGGGGFNSLYLDDRDMVPGDGRRVAYTIGHEHVNRYSTVTFDSERLGPVTYEESNQTLDFANIGHVELRGTGNGNVIAVVDSPDTRDESTPRPMSIDVYAGAGTDDVRVLATTSTVSIFGEDGADVVTIGSPNAGTRDLYGDIKVSNANNYTTLRVDDSAGTRDRSILMDTANNERGLIYGFTGTAIGGFGQSRITYTVADLDKLIVTTGSGFNTVSVADTGRVGDGGAMPTFLSTGSGLNSVFVRGTSGNLTINGGGPLTGVVIGALPNDAGNLARINASIDVLGWVSGLTITDSGSNARQLIYTLESGRFIRTDGRTGVSNGIIHFGQLWMTRFDVVMGNGGNQVIIDGTPTVRSGFLSGVNVYTGNGNDLAFVRGTNGPLSLNVGAGASQVVAVGDATHSLDDIRGPLSVTGGGFIEAVVSNAASTRQQHAYLTANTSPFGNTQTIRREQYNTVHWDTLNTISFGFQNPSRLTYNAGQTGDVVFVRGTLANVPTTVNGGAGADFIYVEADNGTLLAPVYVNGNRAQGDLGFYGDYFTTTPQSYTVSRENEKVRIARGLSNVYYSGLFQLTMVTARDGGNQVSVRDVPSDLSLYMSVANNDAVTMGRPTSIRGFIGGNMNPIQGIVTVAGGKNVSVVVDDVNGQSGRDAWLQPDPDGYGDKITGMGPGEIRLKLDSTASVDIRGGRFNDTFAIDGILKPAIRIDGGAGVNTLDYADFVNTSTGPVAWYRGEFDFTDSVGGHHGTGMNGADFAEAGISGGAFSFDGMDDYIEIPSHPDLAPSALTLEARISPNAWDGNRVIVSKYDDNDPGGSGKSWALSVVDGHVQFGVFSGSTGRVLQTTDSIVDEGGWRHIAATFDSLTNNMSIYVDGQEMDCFLVEGSEGEVGAVNPSETPVRIGVLAGDALNGYFSGRIDDVRIYSRALSSAEVLANSEAGNDSPPAGASSSGVRVHLPTGTATGLDDGIANIQNVIGSAYDDILIGNGGNVLTGGAGRDFLVAGRTPSRLNGGDGDDILIGGFLYADDDDGELDLDAIEAIATEWFRRDADYASRAGAVEEMLAGRIINNDGVDRLFGQGDSDIFFASPADVRDREAGELRIG